MISKLPSLQTEHVFPYITEESLRTFAGRGHNREISVMRVSSIVMIDLGRRVGTRTKTSTFLLRLRFECALMIFLTVARG